MLRVSKKGIVLIEPNDAVLSEHLIYKNLAKLRAKILHRKDKWGNNYEPVGNYVYSVSRREFEKISLALNYDTIIFRGINDCYIHGVEREKYSDNGPLRQAISNKIKQVDFQCRMHFRDYGLLGIFIFKKAPCEEALKLFIENGYEINKLLKNPYVSEMK
jgi:hypothetical protein